MYKILIIGLPGAGKTTFANKLINRLSQDGKCFAWFNGDEIRRVYNDWDFSPEGRLRQTERMTEKANICKENKIIAICDYVCPTAEYRKIFNADILIWIDTIKEGRFEDTNRLFEVPKNYDVRVTDYDTEKWIDQLIIIIEKLSRHK